MGVLNRFSLAGKTAVITGGTGLYGAQFSRALAEAGAYVIVTSRSLENAERFVAAMVADGLRASAEVVDLSQPGSIESFAERVDRVHGGADILVNNAVYRAGSGLAGTTVEDWEATSAINSRGLFLITKQFAPQMQRKGSGSIVNIGSIYGSVGPSFGVYGDTGMTSPLFYSYDKAGMIGFTRYLASALGPDGVRVNCLSPGGLRSEGQDPRFVAAYEERVPLKRMASERDVVGALIFLASDAARYVTGVVLPVDGGWTAV